MQRIHIFNESRVGIDDNADSSDISRVENRLPASGAAAAEAGRRSPDDYNGVSLTCSRRMGIVDDNNNSNDKTTTTQNGLIGSVGTQLPMPPIGSLPVFTDR
jgi:hypothetical protein